VGEESHELAVVPLLEQARVHLKFIEQLLPWAVPGAPKQFPVMVDLKALLERHQLQWPEEDLPEALDGPA
jgi:hypothetical protein